MDASLNISVMIFFDFLFYNICKFYLGYKEKGAESSSAGIVGGLQTINLLILYELALVIQADGSKINIPVVIGLLTVFQIYTYARYVYKESNSFKILEEKWLKKPSNYRKRSVFFQYFYVIVTVVTFLGLAIYLGAHK